MTRVELTRRGDVYRVYCSGHAAGSPEICAAVSCLVYSLAGWTRLAPVRRLRERLESGEAELVFHARECPAEARGAFELVRAGFMQLESLEPEMISVREAYE